MKVQILETEDINDFKYKLSEFLNQGYKIQNSNIAISNEIDSIPINGGIISRKKTIYFAILIKE